MKQVSFSLDIGSASIKGISLKKEGNVFGVEGLSVIPAPQKGLLSESNSDMVVFAEALKQVVKNAGVKIKEVSVSLPEAQVYTKIIDMPSLSEKELAAALKYEMEQYIPLPLDQVKTDWQILGSSQSETSKTISVLIVAAPLALLSKYEQVLDMADLIPVCIETEMLSVQRSLFPIINNPTPSIIVHLGAAATNIMVVKNGIIQMVFTIDKGGLAMTRAISIDLGIDLVQAESYKKAYGLNNQAFEGKIGKSLFPILESITGDIRKATLLYKEKYPLESINQIILSGGAALLPGIDIYLTNQLNIQVVLGNCFQIYGVQNIPDEVSKEAVNFNVAVGLALKNLL